VSFCGRWADGDAAQGEVTGLVFRGGDLAGRAGFDGDADAVAGVERGALFGQAGGLAEVVIDEWGEFGEGGCVAGGGWL